MQHSMVALAIHPMIEIIGFLAGESINEVHLLYASSQTTEQSYQLVLVKLFQFIDPARTVINEPKHITDVGSPDFAFNRGDIAIGWCEAKDIDKKNIRQFAASDYSKKQKERYRKVKIAKDALFHLAIFATIRRSLRS
jgi:hypothetical protein